MEMSLTRGRPWKGRSYIGNEPQHHSGLALAQGQILVH